MPHTGAQLADYRQAKRDRRECMWCSSPAETSALCRRHAVANRERMRRLVGSKGRHTGSLTYRLEAEANK